MTVLRTVRATEPDVVFSPQRKYKTVGSSHTEATMLNVHNGLMSDMNILFL